MSTRKPRYFALVGGLLALCSMVASGEAVNEDSLIFFEQKIRPVLVEHCHECHTSKEKGGLRLDQRARVLRGGDSGRAIIPGEPGGSRLILALHHTGDVEPMPPRQKLPTTVINDIEEWVRLGAPWPDEGDSDLPVVSKDVFEISDEQQSFWSFQPVKRVSPPDVQNVSLPRGGIDQFVLNRLEAEGFTPAALADKRVLLRRATYDLTGLPPTPDEVAAFLADDSKDAFASVVDRLLASPRYGEHWARHWLDGVRYASDVGYYNFSDLGWRYRDWVIKSLNEDLPYDSFVIHQIAGDLIPRFDQNRPYVDGIVATGVLAMGNYDDQESDKEKLYSEVIDDQIDLVSRQFLGLTVSCARCHDHKFDPISTEDYYSLGGIFMSSRVLETSSRIAAHRIKIPLDTEAELERQRAIRERIKKLEADVKVAEKDPAGEAVIKDLLPRIASLKKELPEKANEAIGIREGGYQNSRHKEIADMPVYLRGNPYSLGKLASRRLPEIFVEGKQPSIGEVTDQSGRLELANWIASPENPLTARVMVNRIWQYHFGRGLVRTPSNFGLRGEKPSHPKLLDYLADQFVRADWSLKAMHRLIMNSAVYQQSARADEHLIAADPENRLLGRFSARRLSAEEIRDSLLAVSGGLSEGVGQGRGNREIYARVGHEHSSLVASLFDAPATGTILPRRNESTTAPQALFMMNDASVIKASRAIAERLFATGDPKDTLIDDVYRLIYGRLATPREQTAGVAFLNGLDPSERWTYFQVLLCANEFIHVD